MVWVVMLLQVLLCGGGGDVVAGNAMICGGVGCDVVAGNDMWCGL